MQDLVKLIENRVKDALAKACLRLGVSKSEAYYLVGGHGMIGPLVGTNRETGEQAIIGFQPLWIIGVGLRSTLIGQEPIAGSRPVPSVLPTMTEIEAVVFQLLSEINEIRTQQSALPKLEIGK